MTLLFDDDLADEPELPASPVGHDVPRTLKQTLTPADRIFRATIQSIGVFALVLTGSIGLFLGYQAIPTLRNYGLKFFTVSQWLPQRDVVGVAGVLVGSIEVALVALVLAFPLALATALFISEYAPTWLRSPLITLIDLMAAIPSVVYGVWGLLVLRPHAIFVSRWLSQHFGWIPIFKVKTDPNAATWARGLYTGSAFNAGTIVAVMIVPLACAVMIAVFRQAPIGEREGALALGSTKWGMIRSVVLPFGRGGMIGGTMLALGRALGETVAVLLIISPKSSLKFELLSQGTETISSLIADLFGDSSKRQLSALLTAGFVLFVMTLAINTIAAIFVNRSRSGAGTDA